MYTEFSKPGSSLIYVYVFQNVAYFFGNIVPFKRFAKLSKINFALGEINELLIVWK